MPKPEFPPGQPHPENPIVLPPGNPDKPEKPEKPEHPETPPPTPHPSHPIVLPDEEKLKLDKSGKTVEKTEAQLAGEIDKILKDHGGLESNVPIGAQTAYWSLKAELSALRAKTPAANTSA